MKHMVKMMWRWIFNGGYVTDDITDGDDDNNIDDNEVITRR